ncbi:MAG: glycosyltransferase family 2 protein [Syntrophomonadaceae bacterium]|nr:glycosyltransferase family 2 protein [Syntrophomonadaceae bacterium]
MDWRSGGATMGEPEVYIVIVNWNGWKDTIECLESVQRLEYAAYTTVVVDNGSTDDSLSYIKDWAEGLLPIDSQLVEYDASSKPVCWVEYERGEAEVGGCKDKEAWVHGSTGAFRLVLIRSNTNLGYAGGNNVGIRYALSAGSVDYVWLLNNDTVVAPNALRSLVTRMLENPRCGMCGSTLVYYDYPELIQARGGAVYSKWTSNHRHIGEFDEVKSECCVSDVEKLMDYVVGASLFVSRQFLEDVGLMSEDYFLYFEELDWATRAGHKWAMCYAPGSIVYHKEGATIGAGALRKERSALADYFNLRNRLVFTRKYYPYALPFVCLTVAGKALARMREGRWSDMRKLTGMIRKGFVARH